MDRDRRSTGETDHGIVAWSALLLAAVGAALVAVAVSGNGFGGAGALLSATAFVLAIVARTRHDRWALLWLPLLLFPALVVSAPFWV